MITRRRRPARVVAGVLAAVALLLPSGVAVAADEDPSPGAWPTISQPDTDSKADPVPAGWPAVTKPEDSGSRTDPAPPAWPGPQEDS
jgi:hypothetical protein